MRDQQMMLSEEAVAEFMEIYKKVTGDEITESDARQRATDLLSLYDMFLRRRLREAGLDDPSSPAIPRDDSGHAIES